MSIKGEPFVCYYLDGDTLDKPQAHEHRQPLDKVETNPNEALEEASIITLGFEWSTSFV